MKTKIRNPILHNFSCPIWDAWTLLCRFPSLIFPFSFADPEKILQRYADPSQKSRPGTVSMARNWSSVLGRQRFFGSFREMGTVHTFYLPIIFLRIIASLQAKIKSRLTCSNDFFYPCESKDGILSLGRKVWRFFSIDQIQNPPISSQTTSTPPKSCPTQRNQKERIFDIPDPFSDWTVLIDK